MPIQDKHTSAGRSLPQPQHIIIILCGAVLNLVAVTLGLHGAFGMSLPLAVAGALTLSLIQSLIFEEVLDNGLWLGFFGSLFYTFIVSLNVLLAAGGITAALGANVLGQSTFRASVVEQVDAIRAVSTATSDFAAAMSGVAMHSEQQRAIEIAHGGTCTDSAAGDGPISRLRQDDAASFDAARGTMQQIAGQARSITTTIDSAIANYTVERHDEVVQTIATALGEAQQVARDPRMSRIRASLQERAAQIASGRPDRLDRFLRVLCPRDTMLAGVISQALELPAPQVPASFAAPPVPSESSSVWGLVAALGGVLFGDGGDLGPWRLSILLAPVPDGFFIYGLLLHRRARRARLTHRERLAEHYGLPVGTDPEAAIERALQSPRVQALYASHFRHKARFFKTDYLVVPFAETARRYALLRVDGAQVFDSGTWDGASLPYPVPDLDPSARYQVFGLARGVWSRMEADEVRAALAEVNPMDPGDPSAAPRQEQAA